MSPFDQKNDLGTRNCPVYQVGIHALADEPDSRIADFIAQTLGIDDFPAVTAIARRVECRILCAGDVLCSHGDVSDDIYLVLHGCLHIETEYLARDIRRGEVFGSPAFLTGGPVASTVKARRESAVLRVDRVTFEMLLHEHHSGALRLLQALMASMQPSGSTCGNRQPSRTIAVIPLGDIPDYAGVIDQLRKCLVDLGGRAITLAGTDAAQITAAEHCAETLFLLADPTATSWSHACVAHAEKIIVIADIVRSSPERHNIEHELLGPLDTMPERDCTLVLLHPPGTISPSGTRHWLSARRVQRHVHVRRGDDRHFRRLARILAGQSIGLVLSGGGARGLAHVGVLEALEEAGIEIDRIGGTSIGAVIGGLFAMGRSGYALRQAVREAFIANGNPVGDFHALPLVSLARGARARRVTRAGIINATGSAIDVEDCWTEFFCVATNLSAARSTVLARGLMEQAVLASSAIPGVMPPIVIDQHLYIDGGVSDNLPIDVMMSTGADRIIAVDVVNSTPKAYPFEQIPNPWSLMLDRLPWRRKRRLRVPGLIEIMHKASFIGAVGRQTLQATRADLIIRPVMRGVGLTTWTKMDVAVAAGRAATADQLAALSPALLASLRAGR